MTSNNRQRWARQRRRKAERKALQGPDTALMPAESLRVYREGAKVMVLATHSQVILMATLEPQQARGLSEMLRDEARVAEEEDDG
jgi:hypothetical protein